MAAFGGFRKSFLPPRNYRAHCSTIPSHHHPIPSDPKMNLIQSAIDPMLSASKRMPANVLSMHPYPLWHESASIDEKQIIMQEGVDQFWIRKRFTRLTLQSLKNEGVLEDMLVDPEVIVYGKPCTQHRCVAFFSDHVESYPYAGQEIMAKPMPEMIRDMMDEINRTCDQKVNACLLNLYRDGFDYIGAHRDNQKVIDSSFVATVSIGATREMKIRSYASKKELFAVDLNSGTLAVMQGPTFQKHYTHEIPKRTKVMMPRVSLTFRAHLE